MYSCGPPHMAKQKQDGQLEHTYNSSVRIRDVALKTCQKRWTIQRSDERGSGISMLAARHDDDDESNIRRMPSWYAVRSYLFVSSLITLIYQFLSFKGKELLQWSFHLLSVVEASHVREASNGSEQVIIRGILVRTIYWVWYQFNCLKFLEFIPETSTYENMAKLLTHPSTRVIKLNFKNI